MKPVTTKSKSPKPIPGNNPMNIRIGNTWLGEVPNPTESEYEQFVSIEYGLRAAFCILRRIIRRFQMCTIAQICRAWSTLPPIERDIYITKVCEHSGFPADYAIDYLNCPDMVKLVSAMCLVECGQRVSNDKITKAYTMA